MKARLALARLEVEVVALELATAVMTLALVHSVAVVIDLGPTLVVEVEVVAQ
jgi:hypothetical protein